MNSSKSVLMERYRLNAEQNELVSTLNYLQLRNQDLVREWRTKLAMSALQAGTSPASTESAEPGRRRLTLRALGAT